MRNYLGSSAPRLGTNDQLCVGLSMYKSAADEGTDGEDTDDGLWLLEGTTPTPQTPAEAGPAAFSHRLSSATAYGDGAAFQRLAGPCAVARESVEGAEGPAEQNYGVKWIKRHLLGQPASIRGGAPWAGWSGMLDGMEDGKWRLVFEDGSYELYDWRQLTLMEVAVSQREFTVAYEDGDKQARTHAQMLEDEWSAGRLEVIFKHPRARFSAIVAAQAAGPQKCRIWCRHGSARLVLDRRECEALLNEQFERSQVSKSISDIWSKNERGVYDKVALTAEGGNCISAALKSLGYNFSCDEADDVKAVGQRLLQDNAATFDIRKMKECGPHVMEFLLSGRVERPCDVLGVTDNGGHCVAVRVPSVGTGFIMDSRSRGVAVPLTAAGMAHLGITNVQLVRKVVSRKRKRRLS